MTDFDQVFKHDASYIAVTVINKRLIDGTKVTPEFSLPPSTCISSNHNLRAGIPLKTEPSGEEQRHCGQTAQRVVRFEQSLHRTDGQDW